MLRSPSLRLKLRTGNCWSKRCAVPDKTNPNKPSCPLRAQSVTQRRVVGGVDGLFRLLS
jgi:hypothetical protein